MANNLLSLNIFCGAARFLDWLKDMCIVCMRDCMSLFSLGITLDGKAIKVLYLFSCVSYIELFVSYVELTFACINSRDFYSANSAVWVDDYCLWRGTNISVEVVCFFYIYWIRCHFILNIYFIILDKTSRK